MKRSKTEGEANEARQIDDIDREIVRILQVDGRKSNSDVARRLGVTETTVRKRLAALLEGDYIEIVALPTPRLVGLTVSAILGISTTLRDVRSVAKQVSARTEVRYCGIATGQYSLIVEAFFSDHAHLLSFVTEFLGQIEGVTNVATSLILEIEKFSADWQISDTGSDGDAGPDAS